MQSRFIEILCTEFILCIVHSEGRTSKFGKWIVILLFLSLNEYNCLITLICLKYFSKPWKDSYFIF